VLVIRNFQKGDVPALREIFFNTIRNVNIKDYSEVQVKAWAPDIYNESTWYDRISNINPLIASLDKVVVGYADIQNDGYIDHFFCHWKYQGKGIGKSLMKEIFATGESKCIKRFYSHVSITARPFFEHFGFCVVNEQQVEIRGEILTNYVMEKLV
jgi:putative acetyltransferase